MDPRAAKDAFALLAVAALVFLAVAFAVEVLAERETRRFIRDLTDFSGPQKDDDPRVWQVLAEARRITEQAAQDRPDGSEAR